MCVLVPLTGIYRYVTGCDFLPIKQPKEVKLLSFNLAEQMPFMSNVRRINVDISRRLNDSPGLYGDSFGRKGAADGGRWTDRPDDRFNRRIVDNRRDIPAIIAGVPFAPSAFGGLSILRFFPRSLSRVREGADVASRLQDIHCLYQKSLKCNVT